MENDSHERQLCGIDESPPHVNRAAAAFWSVQTNEETKTPHEEDYFAKRSVHGNCCARPGVGGL